MLSPGYLTPHCKIKALCRPGRVSRSCQHLHQQGCWSLLKLSLPALMTLDPPHRPQNMERNEAADPRGGCSPRSLAGSSPGRVYFRPHPPQPASSHLRTVKASCPAPFGFHFRKVKGPLDPTISVGFKRVVDNIHPTKEI